MEGHLQQAGVCRASVQQVEDLSEAGCDQDAKAAKGMVTRRHKFDSNERSGTCERQNRVWEYSKVYIGGIALTVAPVCEG